MKCHEWALLLAGATAASPALLGSTTPPGVFYVSAYSANGNHTDYDMARQAADAFAAGAYSPGSVLVLKSGVNTTCDAVPLPSLGSASTTSIIGWGSAVSSIVKDPNCPGSAATLQHKDSPNGALSRGLYQGFTVDASHHDLAACEMYGMSLTTFLDVACGDAVANADHVLEFGNRDANSVGWMDNIYAYDLKTFDSVVGGLGAVLKPVWGGSVLTGVTVVSGGSRGYTSQYVRAQIIGSDLVTCSVVPQLTPTRDAHALINGATITNAGSCQSTAHLFILIQDGTPATYGMKFTNIADSHFWDLRATSATTYGEGWLAGSHNNSIYNEQPSAGQLIQITDTANGNRHVNPVFTDPGEYGAAIYSQNGTFQNATFKWDTGAYIGSSGYYAGNDPRVFQDWMIQNSHCSNTSGQFVAVTTRAGLLSNTNPVPGGLRLQSIQTCDGSNATQWATTP